MSAEAAPCAAFEGGAAPLPCPVCEKTFQSIAEVEEATRCSCGLLSVHRACMHARAMQPFGEKDFLCGPVYNDSGERVTPGCGDELHASASAALAREVVAAVRKLLRPQLLLILFAIPTVFLLLGYVWKLQSFMRAMIRPDRTDQRANPWIANGTGNGWSTMSWRDLGRFRFAREYAAHNYTWLEDLSKGTPEYAWVSEGLSIDTGHVMLSLIALFAYSVLAALLYLVYRLYRPIARRLGVRSWRDLPMLAVKAFLWGYVAKIAWFAFTLAGAYPVDVLHNKHLDYRDVASRLSFGDILEYRFVSGKTVLSTPYFDHTYTTVGLWPDAGHFWLALEFYVGMHITYTVLYYWFKLAGITLGCCCCCLRRGEAAQAKRASYVAATGARRVPSTPAAKQAPKTDDKSRTTREDKTN